MQESGTMGVLKKIPQKERAVLNLRAYRSKQSGYLFWKGLFDYLITILLIVAVFWWLFPLIAILIKMDSRGPVFFIQRRTGRFGECFNCFKFRTMRVNEFADTQQADENDPRITRFGNFLRKSCLDELPQFFNVLAGNMSIVGPRPHMLSDCEAFSILVEDYNLRQLMQPGITGMAQVKGYRGKTRLYNDVYFRYQWDIYYVRNANFLLDLKVIRITVFQIAATLINRITKRESKRTARIVELKRI